MTAAARPVTAAAPPAARATAIATTTTPKGRPIDGVVRLVEGGAVRLDVPIL